MLRRLGENVYKPINERQASVEDDDQTYWRIAVREKDGWVWATEPIPTYDRDTQNAETSRVLHRWHPEYVRYMTGEEDDVCTEVPPQDMDELFYEYYGEEDEEDEEDEEELTP